MTQVSDREDIGLPTYEYRCDSCDKNFDVVQSFQDDPLTSCPTCGSPVRKVFGNVGIVFKGSGFYKTDSRNGGSGKKEAEPSTAAASRVGGLGLERRRQVSPRPSKSGDERGQRTPKPSAPLAVDSRPTKHRRRAGTPASTEHIAPQS